MYQGESERGETTSQLGRFDWLGVSLEYLLSHCIDWDIYPLSVSQGLLHLLFRQEVQTGRLEKPA